jgi:hypothetical protein
LIVAASQDLLKKMSAAYPRGYDTNRFLAALLEWGITPCIPSTRSRKVEIPLDKTLYRQRHRIENMFDRLKGRNPLRPMRSSAICIAAAIAFWLT